MIKDLKKKKYWYLDPISDSVIGQGVAREAEVLKASQVIPMCSESSEPQ